MASEPKEYLPEPHLLGAGTYTVRPGCKINSGGNVYEAGQEVQLSDAEAGAFFREITSPLLAAARKAAGFPESESKATAPPAPPSRSKG